MGYLSAREDTTEIRTANKKEQLAYDIDLFWSHVVKGQEIETSVEVKVDGQAHQTGNFAFETISNKGANTPGCFIRSDAEEWYYLTAGNGILYRWKQKAVREWFLSEIAANPTRFKRITPQTPTVGDRQGYSSEAYLVPIRVLLAAGGPSIRVDEIPVPPLPEWYVEQMRVRRGY
jgi:hypothetical protein